LSKIFLSPSQQEKNVGVGNYGTEEFMMNLLADVVQRELLKHKNIEILRNKTTDDANAIIRSSNNFKADIHLALHSNAFKGQTQGCEVFAYLNGVMNDSVRLSNRIYSELEPLTPSKDRGVKDGRHLFEVGDQINAISSLIEVGFHDNWTDASFIIANIEKIGQAIVKGVLDYLIIDKKTDVSLIQNVVETPVKIIKEIVYVNVDVPGPERIVKVEVPGPERIVTETVTVKVDVPGPIEIKYVDKIVMREPTSSECFGIILTNIANKFKKG